MYITDTNDCPFNFSETKNKQGNIDFTKKLILLISKNPCSIYGKVKEKARTAQWLASC